MLGQKLQGEHRNTSLILEQLIRETQDLTKEVTHAQLTNPTFLITYVLLGVNMAFLILVGVCVVRTRWQLTNYLGRTVRATRTNTQIVIP